MSAVYRGCTVLARALADGTAPFVEALAAATPAVREALPAHARAQGLREWFLAAAGDAQARALLPPAFVVELDALAARQPGRVQRLRAATVESVEALEGAGIDVVVLKGLCFAARVGVDPRFRHQFDVDLWVERADLARACTVLAGRAWHPLAPPGHSWGTRVWQALRRRRPGEVTLRREGEPELDLHTAPKTDRFPGLDARGFLERVQRVDLGGAPVATLADEDALLFLVLSIAADLRRGACRAKHLLDLHLAWQRLHAGLDADAWLAAREPEGLLRVVATTLAVYVDLFEVREALPSLAQALGRHAGAVVLDAHDTPLALVTRPRKDPRNLAWFARLVPPRTFAERRRARRGGASS